MGTIYIKKKHYRSGGWVYTDMMKNLARVLTATIDEHATAAVALLLREDPAGRILFVKRVKAPRDLWSGQMALPGGKRDAEDKNILETVMRETAEETGITFDSCQVLGVLHTVETTLRPDMKILPFVVVLGCEPVITLNKKELEASVWIYLDDLVGNKGVATFTFGEFPAYIIGEYTIWGMTYRILEDFFHALELADTKEDV